MINLHELVAAQKGEGSPFANLVIRKPPVEQRLEVAGLKGDCAGVLFYGCSEVALLSERVASRMVVVCSGLLGAAMPC